jgi:hypothetical protein
MLSPDNAIAGLVWVFDRMKFGTFYGTERRPVRMFETRGSATFATMDDLKNRVRETLEKAQEKPVYLLRDGEPIGGVVSLEMLELLQDVLEGRYISSVAEQRLQGIREEQDDMLDADDFWAHADAAMAAKR